MPTLQFKGKNIIWNHHLSVPYHTLDEVEKLDFQPEKANGNLIIEGDNLRALKSLLPHYTGKIRCIYIDPPYNTGNDNGQGKGWIYNDNVNSPLIKEWLGKEVGKDDLTRHDKWLCTMTPRLRILRDLLADEGVIFISVDDIELNSLISLANEIFIEGNHIATLPTIMNLKGNQDEFGFAGTHEYTVVYAKDKSKCQLFTFPIEEENDEWLQDEKGFYKQGALLKATGVNAPRNKRPNLFFPVFYNSETKSVYVTANDRPFKKGDQKLLPITKGLEMSWRWSKAKFLSEPHNIIVLEDEEGEVSIYKKQRPELSDMPSKKPKTIFYKPEYSSGNGTNQLKDLFGTERIFTNPKPLDLIKDLLIAGCPKDGSMVLDSFAGSGTTMHAVMDLNKEDGGTRKCILVQMPEATKDEPEKNICKDITRERVKRAIDKYGYDSGFQYCRIGTPIDAETLLSGTLPTFKQFAEYVYYLCAGESLKKKGGIDEKTFFVGEHGSSVIYLVYKKDFEVLTKLALNLKLAENLVSRHPQKRIIVYAPACFLEEDYMREKSIDYVGIPYNLFQREKA